MNNDEFRRNLEMLTMATRSFLMLSGCVSDDELGEMLKTVSLADSVGFIIDPTAYRTALADGRLDRQKALIEAHQAFRAAVAKHFTMTPEAAAGVPVRTDDAIP